MVKVYKKEAKLLLNIPYEVIEALGLKDQEEVDFFKYADNAFLFAKKSDIANLLMGAKPESSTPAYKLQPTQRSSFGRELNESEVAVLKKLDTLKYMDRTEEKVSQILSEQEKSILQKLVRTKCVSIFKSEKTRVPVYGISKDIYNRYLMRNKTFQKPKQQYQRQPIYHSNQSAVASGENEHVKELEKNGFVVVRTEAEAAAVSLALEDSIRRGIVLGTRAFNKKFYIVMRQFFNNYSSGLTKALRGGKNRVSDLADELKVDPEAARGMLYLMAESGEVSERRKDLFELVE